MDQPRQWCSISGFFILVVLLVACGGDPGTEAERHWERVSVDELSQSLRERFRKAEEARGDLAGTLMGRVSEVMKKEGPAGAVKVCNLEASGLTEQVGNKHGVEIGRTSHRLRNPDNQPPDWARAFDLVDTGVDSQVVLKSNHDDLAVFTPIFLGEKCATCHGPRDEIDPSIRKKLNERYPNDQATGFEPGDLRGWFWVESPSQSGERL